MKEIDTGWFFLKSDFGYINTKERKIAANNFRVNGCCETLCLTLFPIVFSNCFFSSKETNEIAKNDNFIENISQW